MWFLLKSILSIVYMDFEIVWVGLNEMEVCCFVVDYEKGVFFWVVFGCVLVNGWVDGLIKLLVDLVIKKLLGVGIVGVNVGELLVEVVLVLEIDVDIYMLMYVIYVYLMFFEFVVLVVEIIDGLIIDLFMLKV